MTHIPNHIDYIEFPAPDAAAHGASKAFYEQVFGWKYQDWGSDYSDTQGSGLGSGISSQPGTRPLPLAVIEATSNRYREAYERLTGQSL